jgi:putative salt-induced outer membrane protein YdiY
LFGELRHQRDRFKQLESLATPAVGAGVKLVDRERLNLGLDAGVGLAFEKLEGRPGTTDGALRAGQALTWKSSATSTLTQAASAIWKMDDLGDAFYHLELGLASAVSSRLDLKLAALLDAKSRPATPELEKTDEAFVASLVFRF